MDITALTNAITLLRSETQERSISPERVGNLLQQLANLIKSTEEGAAKQETVDEINNTAIGNISAIVATTTTGISVTLTLTELDGETAKRTFSLPVATATRAGVISAADYARVITALNGLGTGVGITSEELAKFNKVASHFVRIGSESTFWVTTNDAELEAAKLEYCADPDKWILYYYVKGSLFGYIEQYLNAATCTQTIHWDNAIKQRTITFTDDTRTEIQVVGEWAEIKTLTVDEKEKLDGLPNATGLKEMIEVDNFGIRFLGNVGSASSVGEQMAATAAIAGNSAIKWIIYTYSSYTAMIHQTHNSTTTVQDLYFAGSKHSRRTITFSDDNRTTISSVGAWTTISSDIGVNRNGNTATIKMVSPFQENAAGVLSFIIGQATTTKAGLLTADNLNKLNTIESWMNTAEQTLESLQSDINSLRSSIAELDNIYVKQPKLYVSADPNIIDIPMTDYGADGGTIAEAVEAIINLSAVNEDNEEVDVRGCNITWRWGTENEASAFSIEYEGAKIYVTLTAQQGVRWNGDTSTGKCIITVSSGSRTGEVEVTLRRNDI